MEHAGLRLLPESPLDGVLDAQVVIDECGHMVAAQRPGSVPAVVPEVVEHEIEGVRELRPERVIEVDREAVAVAEHDARAGGIPVTPERDHGAVAQAHVMHGKGLGHLPDLRAFRVTHGGAGRGLTVGAITAQATGSAGAGARTGSNVMPRYVNPRVAHDRRDGCRPASVAIGGRKAFYMSPLRATRGGLN